MAKKKKEAPPEIEVAESLKIPIAEIDNNVGQIPGVNENPREMTDIEFRKLKKSLEKHPEFTALNELKVYRHEGLWITIGGNMRLQAMKDLGWEYAIGKVIPEGTDAETLNYYILLDNSSFGKWDFDKLANKWREEMLSEVCIEIPVIAVPKGEEEAEEDNYDVEGNLPEKPQSRLGDIYALGDHRLIVGDSTKIEYLDALMEEEAADCLITDPPYNVDYEGSNGKKIQNDKMADAQFQEFLCAAFENANAHLKQGGAFYIWHADSEGYNFRTAAKRTGWQVRQCLIWNKNSLVLGRQDYQWKHEPCLYGWKEGASHYFVERRDLTTIIEKKPDIDAMTKDELKEMLRNFLDGTYPTTVIDENKPLRNAEHPTMKPVPLIGRQISNSTRRKQLVLDTFGGSGTTMIACEQLGRRCRMVEFDPAYADVIIKRWEDLTQKKAQWLCNINDQANTETT